MAIGKNKKVVILKKDLPPVNSDGKYIVRYRIVSDDRNRTSHWSPTYSVSSIPVYPVTANIVTMSGTAGVTIYATWSEELGLPSYDIFTKHNYEISHKSLTNNVATLTTKNLLPHAVGDTIIVSGVDATFNGQYIVTATIPAEKKVSYAKVAADVNHTGTSGLASTNFIFHGSSTTHSYSFIAKEGAYTAEIAIQMESIDNTRSEILEIYASAPITL